jgi:hypothetical protein
MSNYPQSDDEQNTHLARLTDGAGCAEIWEHLLQHRTTDEQVESASE